MIKSILDGGVRGMYMLGENPFLSDPNINKVRKAPSKLDFLVVQDIFLTETAEFADVVPPASSYLEKDGTYTNTDRRVQLGRKVFDRPVMPGSTGDRPGHRPPAGAGLELLLAERDLRRDGAVDAGLRQPHPRQPRPYGKLYPIEDPDHSDGTVVLFDERFNTADGLAHPGAGGVVAGQGAAQEEFLFVLNTGRLLEHWHTGSMTRRSFALDLAAREGYVNPEDAAERGLVDGEPARASRGARSCCM